MCRPGREQALQKTDTVSEALREADRLIETAGPAPDFPSSQWADQFTTIRQTLSNTIDHLDSGGYDQSPLARAVMDLYEKVRETHADYLDAHRDHFYELAQVGKHHFLLDISAGYHVMAFEDSQDAAAWLRYHNKRQLSTLDPQTIPTTGLNPIRTSNILDAVTCKEFLRNRTAEIREYLQRQDDEELQEIRQSVEKLPPEQRTRLNQLLDA